MAKKKIGLIAVAWDGELLEATLRGVKARLAGSGYDLYVFLCFPGNGIDSPDYFGNYNICTLPYYEDYEGFLFSVNVVHGDDMIRRYHPELLECGKPMVSLECKMDEMATIVVDGYSAEYRMVEHLIVEHGCRKLNYVGGPSDYIDNIVRKKAYVDALTAHGIPVEECRMRDYKFVEEDGYQAYADFKELGIELPDAVVCGNDAMALGYCLAAEKDGKYPPDDFLITGFDNDESSKAFTPMISTVDKNYYDMGYLGCDTLFRLMRNEEVPKTIPHDQRTVLRGSCGCYSPGELVEMDKRELQRQIYSRVKEETVHYERMNAFGQNLALSDNEGLFGTNLQQCLKEYDIYGYCMCINQSLYYDLKPSVFNWETGYDEEQCVINGMCQDLLQDEIQIINRRDLVPEYLLQEDKETHEYIFVPLQNQGAGLGYLALVDATSVLYRRIIIHLTSSINSAYSNLRNLENLRKMNKRLDNVYVKDAMTDMYNRFGYMRDGYAMHEKSKGYGKPLMVMFMDMDHLKEINDIYGHSHGDNALILFSGVLKTCAGEDKIAVRYGGDEFLIIGQVEGKEDAEAFKRKLEDELQRTNEREQLPYLIEASIGYVLTNAKSKKELDDYVKEADELMYEVKKKNRKNRKTYSKE